MTISKEAGLAPQIWVSDSKWSKKDFFISNDYGILFSPKFWSATANGPKLDFSCPLASKGGGLASQIHLGDLKWSQTTFPMHISRVEGLAQHIQFSDPKWSACGLCPLPESYLHRVNPAVPNNILLCYHGNICEWI